MIFLICFGGGGLIYWAAWQWQKAAFVAGFAQGRLVENERSHLVFKAAYAGYSHGMDSEEFKTADEAVKFYDLVQADLARD